MELAQRSTAQHSSAQRAAGTVALCFFVSASLFLPRACMSLSSSGFFLLAHRPSSSSSSSYLLFLLLFFLYLLLVSISSLCDLGCSSPGVRLLGFTCSLLLFLPQPTSTNKSQVGIRVDSHLNREQPAELQIDVLSAGCNCT